RQSFQVTRRLRRSAPKATTTRRAGAAAPSAASAWRKPRALTRISPALTVRPPSREGCCSPSSEEQQGHRASRSPRAASLPPYRLQTRRLDRGVPEIVPNRGDRPTRGAPFVGDQSSVSGMVAVTERPTLEHLCFRQRHDAGEALPYARRRSRG